MSTGTPTGDSGGVVKQVHSLQSPSPRVCLVELPPLAPTSASWHELYPENRIWREEFEDFNRSRNDDNGRVCEAL